MTHPPVSDGDSREAIEAYEGSADELEADWILVEKPDIAAGLILRWMITGR